MRTGRGPRLDFRLRLFYRLKRRRYPAGLQNLSRHRRRLLLAQSNSFATRRITRNRRARVEMRMEQRLAGKRNASWPYYLRRPWPHRSLRFEGKPRRPALYL